MSQKFNRLSFLVVRNIREPGLHADGNNLYLNVTSTGSRSWTLIYNFRGKRRELGLGSARVVTLADARKRAMEAAQMRQQGVDPKLEWAAARAPEKVHTFGDVALEVIDGRRAGWQNAKHAQQWENTLRTYAASIWDKSVADVCIDDVLGILRPIWSTKQETASRVRGRVQHVLDAAKARRLRSGDNPALWSGNLSVLLNAHRSAPKRHQPSMPYADVPKFMQSLLKRKELSARALELLILTAGRTTEIREATWGEFTIPNATWSIPAKRMKMSRDHRVALSTGALSLLDRLNDRVGLLFPGLKPGKAISNMTMLALLRRMGMGEYTVHGFRSSFSTWAAEQTSFPRDVVEHALAHVVGSDVERAYRRSDVLEKRVALMQAWSDFTLSERE